MTRTRGAARRRRARRQQPSGVAKNSSSTLPGLTVEQLEKATGLEHDKAGVLHKKLDVDGDGYVDRKEAQKYASDKVELQKILNVDEEAKKELDIAFDNMLAELI